MSIFLKILSIVLIVILIIIILLALLLILPFKYLISLSYSDKEFTFDFKYSVVSFNTLITLKPPIKYYLKIFGITIFDSENKKEGKTKKEKVDKKEARRISDTDFLRDKSISEDLRASDKDARELLNSAKKFEKAQLEEIIRSGDIDKQGVKQKVDSFIDKLHNIIPPDMKYVLKKVSDEVFKLIKKLSPTDVDVDISYGSSDPYMVGISYAILAPLISITGGDINARPEFGTDEIKAKLELARRVPLITIVIPVLRLLLDKKFRNIVLNKK
ncbi:MAG: hypothetical protein J5666_05100 [Bacilli bacterium]|nr:hypothetical protein [Bacilli bacterium]